MAKRIDLRAYQENIAARLAAAQAGAGVAALLGFESGGERWLVDLPAAGEVLPLPALASVPLTRPWFAGLANVHGELQAVVDFSAFRGGAPTPRDGAARILRVGARHGANCALLVGRVHGLKRLDALFPDADAVPPEPTFAWRGDTFTDTQGERWTRLEIGPLLADPAFLDAALPETALPGAQGEL
jgi:twitching motility protein PilI